MYARLTKGATNQSIAELHNIKLFGRPCPTKNPAHKIKRSILNPIAIYFNFILLSPRTIMNCSEFIKLNFRHNSKLKYKNPFVQYGLFPP